MKLDFQEFVEEVIEVAQNILGADYKVGKRTVTKMNSVNLTGVCIAAKDAVLEGCMYLDYIYESAYCVKGEDVRTITENLLNKYLEDSIEDRIDLNVMESWEWVKEHLFCKLINTEMNQELLKDMPHRKVLDLSVVYYICLDKEHGATILVKNWMMEYWGQSEESLCQQAMTNIQEHGYLDVIDMHEIVQETCGVDTDAKGIMYVIRDLAIPYGAVHILNEKAIEKVKEVLGEAFIILPSSVCEVIAVPISECEHADRLATRVRDSNDMCVLPEERLSYHVYRYMDGNMEILT